MTPHEKDRLYNADLDAAYLAWKAKNPTASPDEHRDWTFRGFEAWNAGFKAAQKAAEQQTYGLPDFSPIFGGASSDPKPGECGCYECSSEIRRMTRMITCSQCGNKRCPHATNHIHACTNSNEAGQPGSRYQ